MDMYEKVLNAVGGFKLQAEIKKTSSSALCDRARLLLRTHNEVAKKLSAEAKKQTLLYTVAKDNQHYAQWVSTSVTIN